MSDHAVAAPRPKSPTGVLTGLAGLGAGVATIFLMQGWQAPTYMKTLAVMAAAAVAMIIVEIFVYRPHANTSTGLAAAPVNPLDLRRIGQKLIGFWATIAVIAGLYLLLPEYGGDFYRPFRDAALLCLPLLALLSPLYIAYVDRRQLEPVDTYVQVARLLGGHLPQDWAPLHNYALGWLVKGFFLPLMFVFLNGNLENTQVLTSFPDLSGFSPFYEQAYSLLFMFDVMLAAVGYVLTLRILDTHIRSAEPSLLGWAVCLACYPPFWSVVGGGYLGYDADNLYWGHFFADIPALYVGWGCIILVLVGIYVWATVVFGLRFSNLTYRGVITHGPYRWVKHPAYISKNITWWMISVPFITTMDWTIALQSSLLLAGVNGIYLMRAITEERHLARYPEYRAYQDYIRQHGLWAVLKRRAGLSLEPTPVLPGEG